MLLGKNPTGMNQVLRTIASGDKRELHLLLFLNDGIADGRDISWIWDTDYELLAGRAASVGVSGTRAEELALRLKYAGFDGMAVERDAASRARTRAGRDAIGRDAACCSDVHGDAGGARTAGAAGGQSGVLGGVAFATD